VLKMPTVPYVSSAKTGLPNSNLHHARQSFGCETPGGHRLEDERVFGFLLLGGAYVGATVRDVRLANELHRLGHRVHVWWGLDRPDRSELDPAIPQSLLFHGARYVLGGRPSGFLDGLARAVRRACPDRWLAAYIQQFPSELHRVMHGLLRRVCEGVERDAVLIGRFARQLRRAGVTHMLPSLELFCPFVEAARRRGAPDVKYCVTFQGYEIYANYARMIGLEQALYDRIRETVARSDFPAIAVSRSYRARIVGDVGLDPEQLVSIPPSIDAPHWMPPAQARQLVADHFPAYRADRPLVTFLGRQDSEKGIDLLLYATKLCAARGNTYQLLICGPTAGGRSYRDACRQIAEHLRIDVLSNSFVPHEVRSALFRISDCVVYPSIHDEPFGLVPAEAASYGVPVVCPHRSGVCGDAARIPHLLRFDDWSSESLAREIERAVQASVPPELRRPLPLFSHGELAARMLEHLRPPHREQTRRIDPARADAG
jgi:glycosyltransferase involved in cell wall biosynthesis